MDEPIITFLRARLDEHPSSRLTEAIRELVDEVDSQGWFDDAQCLWILGKAWADHPDWPGTYEDRYAI